MSEDLIEETVETKPEPVEVTIKKEPEKKEPDVDYDDYLPTEKEILETEIEIEKNTDKRRVKPHD